MKREDTLQAIAALPVSDAVKQHATRLVDGLPEWCPEPKAVTTIADLLPDASHREISESVAFEWMNYGDVGALFPTTRRLIVFVADNYGAPACRARADVGSRKYISQSVTDRDVHELLRQLCGMVALTGGG